MVGFMFTGHFSVNSRHGSTIYVSEQEELMVSAPVEKFGGLRTLTTFLKNAKKCTE